MSQKICFLYESCVLGCYACTYFLYPVMSEVVSLNIFAKAAGSDDAALSETYTVDAYRTRLPAELLPDNIAATAALSMITVFKFEQPSKAAPIFVTLDGIVMLVRLSAP